MARIKTNFEKVRDMHTKFNLPINWGMLPQDRAKFRMSLMESEFNELKTAILNNDRLNILEELCDVLYSVYGTGVEYGFDMDKAFDRLHESNMSKTANGNGKLVKGIGYKPKNMTDLV